MGFPFSLGGGFFGGADRYQLAEDALNELTGDGGYTDDPGSVYRRTLAVRARLDGTTSLTIERVGEQITPKGAQDLLPMWERSLRLPERIGTPPEQRRARCLLVVGDHGALTGIAMAQKIAEMIGGTVGVDVFYRFNTAASLALGGYDPRGIYYFAIEVPVAKIAGLGQHADLKEWIQKWKSTKLLGALTREVARGFLCDDPQSLTDRDVLRI